MKIRLQNVRTEVGFNFETPSNTNFFYTLLFVGTILNQFY